MIIDSQKNLCGLRCQFLLMTSQSLEISQFLPRAVFAFQFCPGLLTQNIAEIELQIICNLRVACVRLLQSFQSFQHF